MTQKTPRTIKEKTCKQCSITFSPASGRQEYCSTNCKTQFYKKPVKTKILVCAHCSIEFDATGLSSKFCSADCRHTAAKKVKNYGKKCQHCQTDISEKHYKKSNFCSEKCMGDFKLAKKNQRLENQDHFECPVCHQKMRQMSAKHARMHGYTTAKEMQVALNMPMITCESMRAANRGENNPSYQHGGKYSKFSKKFIHGYDAAWHKNHNKNISKLRNENKVLFKSNIEYWDAKHPDDAELAMTEYKKSQIRDLNHFIEKYGEEEGKIRHRNKTEKWIKTMSDKPEEERMRINQSKIRKSYCFMSKGENEIYTTLKNHFPEISNQFALPVDEYSYNSEAYIYDMKYNNKIIEFNGDFWHSNPNKFDESHKCPYTKRSQKEIHAKDTDKLRIANKHGYEVKIIWESEYNSNKQPIINECIEFLKQPNDD